MTGTHLAFSCTVTNGSWSGSFCGLCRISNWQKILAQDTFLRAYTRFDQYDPARRFGPWLFRIGVNLTFDYLRRRRRRGRWALFSDYWNPASSDAQVPDPEISDPRKALDTRQEVEQVLSQIPEKYRAVLILRDMENFSTSEIAAVLNRKEATIRWRLAEARNMFQRIWLKRQGIAPPPGAPSKRKLTTADRRLKQGRRTRIEVRTMNCKHTRTQLALLVGNDLKPDAVQDVHKHLDQCGGCREHWNRLSTSLDALHGAATVNSAWDPEADGLWNKLVVKLPRQVAKPQPPQKPHRMNGWAATMSVVVACSAMVWVASRQWSDALGPVDNNTLQTRPVDFVNPSNPQLNQPHVEPVQHDRKGHQPQHQLNDDRSAPPAMPVNETGP